MSDLRSLAGKYVELSEEIESVRAAMLAALTTNGAPEVPFARPARSPGGSRHKNATTARAAENAILERLRETPGLTTAAIAKATAAPPVTTQDRLRRLRSRGAIEGGGSSGWQVTAPPT